MGREIKNVKPEIVAAITAALAISGFSPGQGYLVTGVRKKENPWKKAGIKDNIQARQLTMDNSG